MAESLRSGLAGNWTKATFREADFTGFGFPGHKRAQNIDMNYFRAIGKVAASQRFSRYSIARRIISHCASHSVYRCVPTTMVLDANAKRDIQADSCSVVRRSSRKSAKSNPEGISGDGARS